MSIREKGIQAAAPDLTLYLGSDAPDYQEGGSRYVDLNRYRVPDLVGEISDTTLASDLHEKKELYAQLGIPEYWVVDIKGRRVFAFALNETKIYDPIETSQALTELSIELLNQTLEKIILSNVVSAVWFLEQIKSTKEGSK